MNEVTFWIDHFHRAVLQKPNWNILPNVAEQIGGVEWL